MNQVVVGELGFVTNDAGIIDATSFFDTPEFMRGGREAWALADPPDVRAILLHHTAGWYGPVLDAKSTRADELAFIVAMAKDHAARFGIGPAYNLIVFPFGHTWAIGKHRTHRAHTAGREPDSRIEWNVCGRSIVVAGNYEEEPVPHGGLGLGRGLVGAVEEVRRWPGVRAGAPVHEHGLAPTVNSDGVKFSQGTACPGRNIAAWRAAGGLGGEMQPDRWAEGYVGGYRTGYGSGVSEALMRLDAAQTSAARDASALITSPPLPPRIPPTPVAVLP